MALTLGGEKLKHASLPAGMSALERPGIANMHVGECGWTVPWAMYHDGDRLLWLEGHYPIRRHGPAGSADMKVWRDAAGWHVDARKCRWFQGWGQQDGCARPIAVVTAIFD